jgi:pimeloyl-ACP methyl ester carboxylesterase
LRTEPLCQLARFSATDGVDLTGLLYQPRRPRGVVIYLHGTGGSSIFDSKRTNLLAAELLRHHLTFFPFNNRGAHLVRRLGRKLGGMAYERIRDCIFDIDGALRFLRSRGYRDIHLAGHSTGANKIAVYDHYKPRNSVRSYILLAGGDDVGLMYRQLGRSFRSVLNLARRFRNREELVPKSISKLPMSWRSLYDMINPDGDYNVFPFLEAMGRVKLSRRPLFRHIKGIRKPALAIFGEHDEYCFGDVPGCVAALANAVAGKPKFETVVIGNADHGFTGKEAELGSLMAGWLTSR